MARRRVPVQSERGETRVITVSHSGRRRPPSRRRSRGRWRRSVRVPPRNGEASSGDHRSSSSSSSSSSCTRGRDVPAERGVPLLNHVDNNKSSQSSFSQNHVSTKNRTFFCLFCLFWCLSVVFFFAHFGRWEFPAISLGKESKSSAGPRPRPAMDPGGSREAPGGAPPANQVRARPARPPPPPATPCARDGGVDDVAPSCDRRPLRARSDHGPPRSVGPRGGAAGVPPPPRGGAPPAPPRPLPPPPPRPLPAAWGARGWEVTVTWGGDGTSSASRHLLQGRASERSIRERGVLPRREDPDA